MTDDKRIFTAADFTQVLGPGQGGLFEDVYMDLSKDPYMAQVLATWANAILKQRLEEK